MNHRALFASCLFSLASSAAADITLIGKAAIPGNATDKSGLSGTVGRGIPNDRLGSCGSAIAYTGRDDRYIMLNDRGPGDGATMFRTRFQRITITVDPASSDPVKAALIDTTLLAAEDGTPLMGSASLYHPTRPERTYRYDPEGARISRHGTLFMCEEYGPSIDEFGPDGVRIRRLPIPPRFLIASANADGELELPPANTSGRQSNRGFEGLAISADGATLWAIPQSPLIQDSALDGKNRRMGRNLRILEMKTNTAPDKPAQPREFVYQLEDRKHGPSEVVAIGPVELLVLERDGNAGSRAEFRALYRVNIAGATDVGGVDSLPEHELPDHIIPVRKTFLLDFMDPCWNLAGPDMPEKIEGLAFGPDLPDGRHLLLVTTDNDFLPEFPTIIWAFAIDAADLPGFTPQRFDDRVEPSTAKSTGHYEPRTK